MLLQYLNLCEQSIYNQINTYKIKGLLKFKILYVILFYTSYNI